MSYEITPNKGRFQKGQTPWNKGKKNCFSNATRKKMSKNAIVAGRKPPVLKGVDSPCFGKHLTAEHKRKISEATKGKKVSNETRQKLSESHIGQIAWNKGISPSIEARKNMSEAHKGIIQSVETKRKNSEAHRGSKAPAWKGGITPLMKQIRACYKYRLWRDDVFTRDDFTCQKCNNRGVYLHAHHIKRFSEIIAEYKITTLKQALECAELWNINNGITLCVPCHDKIRKGR